VTEYRTDGRTLIKRALEEIRAGQYIADVIETPREDIGSLAQKFKKSYIDEKYAVEIRRVGQVDAATVYQTKISQC
jgi:hypothetical protein